MTIVAPSTQAATVATTTAPAATSGPAPGAGPDAAPSPPVPPPLPRTLPVVATIGWGAVAGLGLGVLAMRGHHAGWSPRAVATGAWRGAAVGAGVGATLLATDHLTGGALRRQLELAALDRTAQAGFVLRHPRMPWLAPTALATADAARAAQRATFGTGEPLDGAQDAFRHAYAAALLALRAMRDHDVPAPEAHQLAIDAGAAHERDGQDNNDAFSRAMDEYNNVAGTRLLGDGRARDGEPADTGGFLTEDALRSRVLDAMAAGALRVVDRLADGPAERATGPADLPG